MLKPSELSPATSALMAELISKYLDPDVVRVVNGAIPETTKVSLLTPSNDSAYIFNGDSRASMGPQ